MDDTISRQALYEKTAEREASAMRMVQKYMHSEDPDAIKEWAKWSVILAERTAFKHDVADMPSVEQEYMLRIHQDSIEWVRKKSAGRWMHHKTKGGKNWWRCSECGAVTENASTAHYCYNCGAVMKGGVDGADGNG